MFNADPKTLQRIAPQIARVLVVDSSPQAAKLLADLLKDLGARQTMTLSNTDDALRYMGQIDPQLIFTDYMGPDIDGPDMVMRLRRSNIPSRRAPVVMVTSTATVESIKAARDSGVHEFLRKPYTAGDLFRRVENVVLKPRMWIDAQMYVGPDRRRFNTGEFSGEKKRRADTAQSAEEMLRQAAAAG